LEGLAWFDAVLTDDNAQRVGVTAATRTRALADRAMLAVLMGAAESLDQAQQALAMAREVDDPALLARALTACGYTAVAQDAKVAGPYFVEALGLARALGDPWRLSQILTWQARGAVVAGDPIALRAAAEEGRDLAEAIGDRFVSRQCRYFIGWAQLFQGDLAGAAAQCREVVAEANAAHEVFNKAESLAVQGVALAWQGETGAARAAADAAVVAAAELGGIAAGVAHSGLAVVALAAGDLEGARDASETARQHMSGLPAMGAVLHAYSAQAAIAGGDLLAARRGADDAVATTTGWWLMWALRVRARVAIAQGDREQAERDAFDALAIGTGMQAYFGISDVLECLAVLAGEAGSHREAARLLGAAEAIGQRMRVVRFKVSDAGYEASVTALRDAVGEQDFDAAWAEGAALSTEEAIAYAQRGRGERKRPASGWASLTPAERDVVRLVSEGLGNNDIATRLFVSPRTVQSHLTHVYTKLGLTSRVQLAQEAARHG
jgi:DNA-binding CsgD family transcriptional regulator